MAVRLKTHLESIEEQALRRLRLDFLQLFESSEHSDMELTSRSVNYPAHKVFLKARLPHVRESLMSYSCGDEELQRSDMQNLLRWAYGDESAGTLDKLVIEAQDHTLINASIPLEKVMIEMIGDEETSDVVIIAEDCKFHVHRAILSARSQYFAAMFGGSWVESSSQKIQLQGVTPLCLRVVLEFIYGAKAELPDSVALSDLLIAADIFILDGLRDVVAFYLAKRCCFFHKPCKLCTTQLAECRTLSALHRLSALKSMCLRWSTKYFDRLWCTRSFCTQLSPELHQEMVKDIIQSLNNENAIDILRCCDRLSGNTPHVGWADPVRHMTAQVEAGVVDFIASSFKGIGWSPVLVGKIFNGVVCHLCVANCCSMFGTAFNIKTMESIVFNEEASSLVADFFRRCKGYVTQQLIRVRDTTDWKQLPKTLQDELEESSASSFVELGSNSRKLSARAFSSRNTVITGRRHPAKWAEKKK
ncbi:BTB/POZ domain-containing protein 8-like isoform X2 [Corticium candelabrum]|uniref:BTB/POZ domain-containing protein 8-like isoform X2 n=1 Tax=Corticium candelabrum TaxID=121492 RepID=UPI002E274A46|nr:BTB/POZ domain-containing protein 8-like isoform X2 [Corticium candelabrum]